MRNTYLKCFVTEMVRCFHLDPLIVIAKCLVISIQFTVQKHCSRITRLKCSIPFTIKHFWKSLQKDFRSGTLAPLRTFVPQISMVIRFCYTRCGVSSGDFRTLLNIKIG